MNERIHIAQADIAQADVAVVGAGPAGITTALALAHVGANVALIGPAPSPASPHASDTRTAALLASSVDLLKRLDVWETLARHAAPLKAIRIIDTSDGVLRGPEIEFAASELGLEAFGYNIPNSTLVDALYARAVQILGAVHAHTVAKIDVVADRAVLYCPDGPAVSVRLAVGADGRRSIVRQAAGIATSEWRYDQAAIATSFEHKRPHGDVSNELYQLAGSVTTVPLPDPHGSSVIWVGGLAEIEALMGLEASDFGTALEERLKGLLGEVGSVDARAKFPVAGLTAKAITAPRIALAGEAAHILPPIGAQGLNLGLRDGAALADCVAAALRRGADPGGAPVLKAYADARRLDILTRTVGVDLLTRSLLTSLLPVQAARGLVLHGLNAIGPLRRFAMRAGMTPPNALPSLMRPAASG
jgi:2-octaprenyl-6-methoxyphenol hydroxylase